MKKEGNDRAVVLLSGGLDSATTLALAIHEQAECFALSFDYGQRHGAELNAARRIAKRAGVAEHRIMAIDTGGLAGSSLTDPDVAVPETPQEGIPNTYVPARNTVFLALALGYAEVHDARNIYIGVNAIDYSGYPDCRPEYIAAFQSLAKLATRDGVEGRPATICAPLIEMSKAEIIARGIALGIDYTDTVSCYQADEQGRACGLCDSCRLRRAGFDQAGIDDPTRYQPTKKDKR